MLGRPAHAAALVASGHQPLNTIRCPADEENHGNFIRWQTGLGNNSFIGNLEASEFDRYCPYARLILLAVYVT